ncbi:putative glycine dehydrogenase (decarboxylating) subunit 1 [Neobacillus rhizosphaerae]|uniref:Glycine dehydrogenase (Decarboxylating) subunit 1 n=1 Tax=Neobacillus rhizosphaerae TaxID=2880965 RepID=A0ABM9EQY8_9BACI|nr:PLP-dependent transferase [Neobacillus rhizosphaerae]CAH2715016.1 putative glycine dehydrogenase (decarboxylating) subunit 1 [Neobacillus rhizosphaerae]
MTKKIRPDIQKIENEMIMEISAESCIELKLCSQEELHSLGEWGPSKPQIEYEIPDYMEEPLNKNVNAVKYFNVFDVVCCQNNIPPIYDEGNQRSKFLTFHGGEGRFQGLVEYQSLIAELLDMDVVKISTFDWGKAAALSIRMASRITGRKKILAAKVVSPDRFKIISYYGSPELDFAFVDYDKDTGLLDLEDLKKKISNETAAVYFENPAYLGFIESQGSEVAEIIKEHEVLLVVNVDPISLGLLAPPSCYGADIVCGELHRFGMNRNQSGGQVGFIAVRDEEKFINEFPPHLVNTVPTEWLSQNGMYEIGQTIMQNCQYAVMELNKISGVKGSRFSSPFFEKFIVDFNGTGLSIELINERLLEKKILGGKDLSKEFPEFGQSALYSVTEIQTRDDIASLIKALSVIISSGER